MIDPTSILTQIADDDGDDHNWTHHRDLDGDASTLEVGNLKYNLKNPVEAGQAHDQILKFRNQLQNGTLDSYEGKSTEYGEGGRANLLHDQVRAEEAMAFHRGQHSLTWQEQVKVADDIVSMRAAQTRIHWVK